jgi:alpha-glucosidase
MRRIAVLLVLSAAAVASAAAQDEQRVASPDGQIEFRLFIDKPDAAALFRLAYRVSFHEKPLINTSFVALRIQNQEPDLGDNVGLVSAKTSSSEQYNGLLAEYMQNGSLGRRINVEVRAYNDGVAFRYVIPESTPLMPMLLQNEFTEFEVAEKTDAVSRIAPGSVVALPFIAEQPGVGWIAIEEARSGDYPRMYLTREEGNILLSRLPPGPKEPDVAWEGATPMTCPWRVLAIGATRDQVTESKLAKKLHP